MLFIFALIVICGWLFGQFVSAVAATIVLGLLVLYLVTSILTKLMGTKTAGKAFDWINKSPKNTYIAIALAFVSCVLIGIILGASQLSDYDITWESASWTTKESTIGIEYEEDHSGVLVTNNGKKTVTVSMMADFYDKDENWLETNDKNWTGAIAPGQSRFVEITPDDDAATFVKYSLEKQEKVNYMPLAAGFEDGLDVVFEINAENKDFIVKNNTSHEIAVCGCQFIYYDANGKIVYVDTVGASDIPAGKKISTWFDMEEPTKPYETVDSLIYAFYEK